MQLTRDVFTNDIEASVYNLPNVSLFYNCAKTLRVFYVNTVSNKLLYLSYVSHDHTEHLQKKLSLRLLVSFQMIQNFYVALNRNINLFISNAMFQLTLLCSLPRQQVTYISISNYKPASTLCI